MPRSSRKTRSRRSAFTVVELLAVVAVVVLLIGLLMPALAGVRNSSRATASLTRMRQVAMFTMRYAQNNDDRLPRSQHSAGAHGVLPWTYQYYRLLEDDEGYTDAERYRTFVNTHLRCPFDRRESRFPSFGLNVYYELSTAETGGRVWHRLGAPPTPSATVLYGPLRDDAITDHVMAHYWSFIADEDVEIAKDRSPTVTWRNCPSNEPGAATMRSTTGTPRPRARRGALIEREHDIMIRKTTFIAGAIALTVTVTAMAMMPPLGGPMNHIAINIDTGTVEFTVQDPAPMRLENYLESYQGNFAALDGTYFNGQFGWVRDGFWSLDAGEQVWIEVIDQTPGLSTFLGGPMFDMPNWSLDPIFGTDGSGMRIPWDQLMLHNWYAANDPGSYEATYRVYVGDDAGVPVDGYTPGEITLRWALYLREDIDENFRVDVDDVLAIVNRWGDTCSCREDVDGTGVVDVEDLLRGINAWTF